MWCIVLFWFVFWYVFTPCREAHGMHWGDVCMRKSEPCFPLSQMYPGINSFTAVFLPWLWYWSSFRPTGFLPSPSPGSRRLHSPASCAPPVHLTMAAEAAVSCKPNLTSSLLTSRVPGQAPPLHLSNPGTATSWALLALCHSQLSINKTQHHDRLSQGTMFLSQKQTFSTKSALSCQSLSSVLDIGTPGASQLILPRFFASSFQISKIKPF